jgi:hypothetical protein
MLLKYYGVQTTVDEVAEQFSTYFMSRSFNQWFTYSLDIGKYEDSAMLCCAQYLMREKYPQLPAAIVQTDVDKLGPSYVKRKMPVLLTGRFPLLSGRLPNTILVKGFVGQCLVVNDPRGNANTGYVDRFGENMVYATDRLKVWTSEDRVLILRVLI